MTPLAPPPIVKQAANGCVGKMQYASRRAARAAAKRRGYRVYRCPVCDRWHLTSKSKRG